MQINHQEIKKMLFSKFNVQQTLHFVLSDTFVMLKSEITDTILQIHKEYSLLLNSVLSQSEQSEYINELELHILLNDYHKSSAALLCIQQKYVIEEMNLLI